MPIAKCYFEPYGANLDRKDINFPIEHNPYNGTPNTSQDTTDTTLATKSFQRHFFRVT